MAGRRRSNSWCVPLLLALAGASAAQADGVPTDPEQLRERLTEREDENRPERPWTLDVFGHPLTVSGEYEIAVDAIQNFGIGDPAFDADQVKLEQEIEAELFYTFGPPLSLFAQLRVALEEDLDDGVPDPVSALWVEREEMWLFAHHAFESPLNLEIGRLDFEDDRLWWWDENLDAVRASFETERFELALSVAQELAPVRSDQSFVDPANERVLRLLGEMSWDWSPNHSLELFAIRHDDHSVTQDAGTFVAHDREDDSDAELYWLGARLGGALSPPDWGLIGYWIDTGMVRGREDFLELEELSADLSQVESVTHRRVSGWAFDAGVTWIFPLPLEPRLTLAWARGSSGYRQTGIEANEIGFGGVQRFHRYGELLDPELSNLSVAMMGVGCSLFRSSSLDLTYHRYRLVEGATSLRGAQLDPVLTGASGDVGHEFDLVLGVEEWDRFELELIGSAFRAGDAFAVDAGDWAFNGVVALRIAF